jgi:hypothetical protein
MTFVPFRTCTVPVLEPAGAVTVALTLKFFLYLTLRGAVAVVLDAALLTVAVTLPLAAPWVASPA